MIVNAFISLVAVFILFAVSGLGAAWIYFCTEKIENFALCLFLSFLPFIVFLWCGIFFSLQSGVK